MQLTIEIRQELYEKLEIAAKKRGLSLEEWLIEDLEQRFLDDQPPLTSLGIVSVSLGDLNGEDSEAWLFAQWDKTL